ncbi:hypothetical protein [Colwellia psychrerythraea]|uniref:Lipoprotein n=1 Tax=Colwellia psychrerythraea TaxID=28229 RepID=A0A099KIW6_COLPS|nr:hypothetical protein [Colwellia psychrerythraea]KGJ90145.1 hypothetical protein ND2E_3701 [Colwellia psychrerythraea]
MPIKLKSILGLSFLLMGGCSQLHHVHIGDIDQSQGTLTPFTIQVNELGFDLAKTAEIGAEVAKSSSTSEDLELVAFILAISNFGPKTGNPVYNDAYAAKVLAEVIKVCPSKKLTGLTSVREATNVGPVSGEVVSIKGYCINNNQTNNI